MRSDETSPRKTRPGTGAHEQQNNRKRAWARAPPVITCDVDESVQSVREPCVNTQAEGISLGSSSPASLYRISLVRQMNQGSANEFWEC
jgi:hypothetical protein